MKKLIAIIVLVLSSVVLNAQTIERVEPLNWWVGMKTPLQLMIYGEGIARYNADIVGEDVRVTAQHRGTSNNYLFVDVAVGENAKSGTYTIRLTAANSSPIEIDYQLFERTQGSALRASFGRSDLFYLLMPDRFANGDPTNDSTDKTVEKANRNDKDGRHGGDIQGIIDHLDYLQSLGVTTIWTTPVLLDNEQKCTYHGYACADYYHIDPRFGSNQLYRQYTQAAHDHGIKIVMDFVTNHCGTAHWWMNDLPFEDWINVHPSFTRSNYAMSSYTDPNASQYDRRMCDTGWFDTTMPDMNLRNEFVRRYFTQCAVWWIEWAGIDGLRVDTFPYNDKQGVADWCASVRNEYPNISIVGECWFHSPDLIAYWQGDHPNHDGYNSNLTNVMDFCLHDAFGDALRPNASVAWDGGVMKIYNSLSHDFLYNDARDLLIFLANHDTLRSGDLVEGECDYAMLGITMLATMRGIPQLYVGDECMLRADDVNGGDGAKRVDFPGGWAGDKHNAFTAKGRTAAQNRLFDHASKLFNWRKNNEVIHSGRTLHFRPEENLYVYFRYNDSKRVMVIVNASTSSASIDWSRYAEMIAEGQKGVDLLSGKSITVGQLLSVDRLSSMVVEME